jgi:hypothetical protein
LEEKSCSCHSELRASATDVEPKRRHCVILLRAHTFDIILANARIDLLIVSPSRKWLAGGRLTVIDAMNVQSDSRKPLVALARQNLGE